jgi:hypothetical protein
MMLIDTRTRTLGLDSGQTACSRKEKKAGVFVKTGSDGTIPYRMCNRTRSSMSC